MALQAFMQASPKAKVYNGLFLLFELLAWISTCVSFGSPLATATLAQLGGSAKFKLYHHYLSTPDGTHIKYNQCAGEDGLPFCHKCDGSGKAFVAFQVFAFLGLLAGLALTSSRVFGFTLPRMEPTRKVLFFELLLTSLNTFFFFLSVCIWGGACFHAVSSAKGWSVTGTGFGFTIAVFFFLVVALVLIVQIRGDSATHLGAAGAGGEYGTDEHTTSYNPPSQYLYNADPAATYAGSYHSDVMPATQTDNQAL